MSTTIRIYYDFLGWAYRRSGNGVGYLRGYESQRTLITREAKELAAQALTIDPDATTVRVHDGPCAHYRYRFTRDDCAVQSHYRDLGGEC